MKHLKNDISAPHKVEKDRKKAGPALALATLAIFITWLNANLNAPAPEITHDISSGAQTLPKTTKNSTREEDIAAITNAPSAPEKLLSEQLGETSLDGTQPPATLRLDADGHLIIDYRTRDILDYFMSLRGELAENSIRALIETWATDQASADAAQELLGILDRYKTYLETFSEGRYAANNSSDAREKLRQRRILREQIMGPELSNALFQNDDAYDAFSLSRVDIMASEMDETEKNRALEQLENSLPEPLAKQYKQQRALRNLTQQEQALREEGASEAQIYAMHQQEFGDAAAARLQQLEGQRTEWRQRYDEYASERDRIHQASLAPSDKAEQLTALRTQLFSEPERLRAAALDRMRQSELTH